jgi:hypothetical protein
MDRIIEALEELLVRAQAYAYAHALYDAIARWLSSVF